MLLNAEAWFKPNLVYQIELGKGEVPFSNSNEPENEP